MQEKPELSIIVPSYNCKYATKTVEDLFEKASGAIEIIIILDNYWPNPPLKEHSNLTIIHKGSVLGMRDSINKGVSIAKGKYIMKVDDHCMFSEGFDLALEKDMESDWLVVPSRYSLDAINWKPIRCAVEYEYLAYPYKYTDKFRYGGIGLYSKKWLGENGDDPINMGVQEFYKREDQRKHIKIDDIMIFQGSCWFMEKKWFNKIKGLFNYKTMYQEPAELIFKTWLSGGRCVVNKNAWYAHMFKGKDFGEEPNIRGYTLDLHAMRETERYGTWYWMNDCWLLAVKKIGWLIEKFWPVPGWPDNWEEQRDEFYKKYPMILKEGEI